MQMTLPDLAEVVESVVVTMLGLDVGAHAPDGVPGSDLGASVQITGGWEGAVVVACDAAFALRVTESMFGEAAGSVDDVEVADAIGELANMIGGNVKALVGDVTTLSLPTVVRGGDLTLAVPGAVPCATVAYAHDDGRLDVTVYRRETER